MNLPEFVDWFRHDLVYKAPEEWPGRISWFLSTLLDRYGNAPDLSPDVLEPTRKQLGPVGYQRAVELCDRVRDADTAEDAARAGVLLGQLAALLAPTIPTATTPETGA